MQKIEICTNEDAVKDAVQNVTHVSRRLTELRRMLRDLGATDVTIDDLEEVVNQEGHPAKIREVILKGKDLRVAGIAVNPDTLQLPEQGIREASIFARKVDPGRNHISSWSHFEIKGDAVVCAPRCEKDYRKRFTTFGSVKSREIIDDTQKLCDMINAIGKKIGIHQHHPLRDPQRLINWNANTQNWEPNIAIITDKIK